MVQPCKKYSRFWPNWKINTQEENGVYGKSTSKNMPIIIFIYPVDQSDPT